MKQDIFDKFSTTEEITVDQWKNQSSKHSHLVPDEVQQMILEEIKEGDKINRQSIVDILDIYQFLPIKVKRDKNRSENLYYILNSNKRG